MDKNITINITGGSIVKAILFVVLFIVLFLIRDIILVILTAVVIASAIEPMTKWLGKKGVSRLLSVVFVYFTLAVVLVGIFYTFVPTLINDTSSLLSSAPRYIDSISLWNPLSEEKTIMESKGLASDISETLNQSREAVREISSGSFRNALSDFTQSIAKLSGNFLQTVSVVFGGILSLVLIIVLSFYLAVQEDGIAKFLQIVTPKHHETYVIDLWRRSQIKIGYWMQGQLLLAVLVGILVYLGLTIVGVRNALAFAFLAAVFEIIPIFGPILSAIPAVAVSYVDGGLSLALIVAGIYLIIQQFENHLIYPLVVKKIVGVPPILVILALIIGGKLAGFLGILLSVPVAATLMEYFDDLEKVKKTRWKGGESKT